MTKLLFCYIFIWWLSLFSQKSFELFDDLWNIVSLCVGPLAVVDQNRNVLVGVICFIHECGDPVVPTVGIRVSTIKAWILANSDAGQWQCDP